VGVNPLSPSDLKNLEVFGSIFCRRQISQISGSKSQSGPLVNGGHVSIDKWVLESPTI
jgi:hypothetical protein